MPGTTTAADVDAHHDATLTVELRGAGPDVVLVHGEDGVLFLEPFLDSLAATCTVHLVHLPGWGVTAHPAWCTGVDDLAVLLLDHLETLGRPVTVVGLSLGAWVVADAATRDRTRFAGVVLVAPVGIKTLARDERSYVDLWATDPDVLRGLLYGAPDRAPDLTALDGDAFLALARAQEAVARYAWEPYLHDPKLARRLRRIAVPTLVVTGSDDRFVLEPASADRWVERLGGTARAVVLDGAGHRVEEEEPVQLAALVGEFAAASA
jgi:pimeloyl-ACP methyl ester carboxylesterase